jgi:hypothetical protein
MQAPRLASSVRARLAEAGRDRDRRPTQVAGGDLELVPLRDGGLVDVAGEDQLGAGVDQRGEHVAAACNRLLPGAPGRPDQMVVERDHAKRTIGRGGEQLGRSLQLARPNAPGLMSPGPHRVEADDEEAVRAVDRLRRLPVALEFTEGPQKPGWEGPRDVVIPGDHEQRRPEPLQKSCRAIMLAGPPSVRQVAAGDDQIRPDTLDQGAQRALDLRLLNGADMQV